MDDSDFKAIGLTREQFASLAPTSTDRITICKTRKLWRLIKVGKADACDFTLHYKGYNANYFDDAEVDKVMDAQTKAAQGLADKLSGAPKKCQ